MPLSRFSLILISSLAFAQADVKLPAIFSDHAVLEKSVKVPVWGKADPGEKVTLALGAAQAEAIADEAGRWRTSLDLSQSAAGPFELLVSGKNTLKVTDVLVGDVWVCSGQSNMEWSLANAAGGASAAEQTNQPQLRFFKVPRILAEEPAEDLPGKWEVATPQSAATFSAVGYHFGSRLQKELNIPIGLIQSAWGGTPSESWTSAAALANDPELQPTQSRLAAELKSYPERLEAYLTERPAWETKYNRADPGTSTLPNETDWQPVKNPAHVTGPGAAWFRLTIPITPDNASKTQQLTLSKLSGIETVYWNGKKLGTATLTQSANDADRTFAVTHAKEGTSELLIRIFDPAHPIHIKANFLFGRTPAQGTWEWQSESSLPPLTAAMEADFPKSPGKSPKSSKAPSLIYNAMIHPLMPYAIKGVIWYQGESNANRAYQYRKVFPLMITDWRKQWGQGDFPFYFCQLANFRPKTADIVESSWAELREAQAMTLALPRTGQAVLIDLGEADDIHPRNKQDVGERLARIALARDYGRDVVDSGPTYASFKIEGDKVRISFQANTSPLVVQPLPETYPIKTGVAPQPLEIYRSGSPLQGFAICGEDKVWHWADAKLDGETVLVSSAPVPQPIAVRYAWANNPTANLGNAAGLPASPFRTDDFPASTREAKF